MARSAKDIVVKPITSKDANRIVKKYHYSGKVVNNSQLHFGVFMDGRCLGAMSFGPSMDKRKTIGLVKDTRWNGFLELNRMAFADELPRNSESRAISVALRMIKKYYPHVEWVLSYSDGTQCGDGTIYRASGFYLIGISENKTILQLRGEDIADITINSASPTLRAAIAARNGMIVRGQMRSGDFLRAGANKKSGFQLRYIYFINPAAKERLSVPIIPFSKIDEMGAGMYKGKRRAQSIENDAAGFHPDEGGVNPTCALQTQGV